MPRLYKAGECLSARVLATDGAIGRVVDLLFDDEKWVVRYLIVDTEEGLGKRRVLVSPRAVRFLDHAAHRIFLNLTRERVAAGPQIEIGQSVSREHESEFHRYYGYPEYWQSAAPQLHSTREVTGFQIQARDAPIGQVEDFRFDDSAWAVRDLIVNTRHWLPGQRLRIAPGWIQRVRWEDRVLELRMRRAELQRSAPFERNVVQL